MGRTIKISELKKFDVFKWEEYLDERLVSMDAERFDSLDNDGDNYFFLKDMDKEVELLGRMVYKDLDELSIGDVYPNGREKVEFEAEMEEEYYRNNQGAQ